jgi:hypothetical protein
VVRANENQPNVEVGISLEPVTSTFLVSGGALREDPLVTVRKSGYASSNTGATDQVRTSAGEQSIPLENLHVTFGANVALGIVGMYLSQMETVGSMPLRVSGNTLIFHLGGVFKDNPAMRPNTTLSCAFKPGTDAKGKACFLINIGTGLPKRKGRAKSGSSDEPTPAAATAKSAAAQAPTEQGKQ